MKQAADSRKIYRLLGEVKIFSTEQRIFAPMTGILQKKLELPPSFFARLKTKTLIYRCFHFAKTAKNAILGSL